MYIHVYILFTAPWCPYKPHSREAIRYEYLMYRYMYIHSAYTCRYMYYSGKELCMMLLYRLHLYHKMCSECGVWSSTLEPLSSYMYYEVHIILVKLLFIHCTYVHVYIYIYFAVSM